VDLSGAAENIRDRNIHGNMSGYCYATENLGKEREGKGEGDMKGKAAKRGRERLPHFG